MRRIETRAAPKQRRPAEAGRYKFKDKFKDNVKDTRLKSRRPLPFDPAQRDLRMNRRAGRFTNSKATADAHI
jgi:hypothetical protein